MFSKKAKNKILFEERLKTDKNVLISKLLIFCVFLFFGFLIFYSNQAFANSGNAAGAGNSNQNDNDISGSSGNQGNDLNVGNAGGGNSSPTVTLSSSASSITENSNSSITLTATLSETTNSDVTIAISTSGSATEGTDYNNVSDITITAGNLTGTTSFSTIDDNVYEGNETATIAIDSVSGGNASENGSQSVNITLTENESLPSLSIIDATVNSESGNASITISVSGTSTNDITIDYATSDGTATAGEDYSATSGTLTISAGQTSGTITVPILADTLDEDNETLTVTLSNPSNATVSDSTATLTITDNDDAPSLSINDISTDNENASNAQFTVSLSAASSKNVTVDYATSDGTATAGEDYSATSGTLTISAGQTSGTFNVAIVSDTTDESNETVIVNLSNAVNATINDSRGVLTITDDEGTSGSNGSDGTNGANLNGTDNLTTSSNISGGDGNNGTNGTNAIASGTAGNGANGGNGGTGVAGTDFTLTVSSGDTISGGDGGDGGAGGDTSTNGVAGDGGDAGNGGDGIKGSGFTLINTGTVSGGVAGAIGLAGDSSAAGATSGSNGSAGTDGYGIFVIPGNETNITNLTGRITSSSYDIYNTGTINTLDNGQNNLDYSGALPENYNTYIASTTSYGKTDFTDVTGTMSYGLYSTSTVTDNTYSSVLSGVTADNVSTDTRTGTFGGYTWTLQLAEGSSDIWDLVIVETNNGEELLYTNRFAASGLDLSDSSIVQFCEMLVEMKNAGMNPELHDILDSLSNSEFKNSVMSIKGKSLSSVSSNSATATGNFTTAVNVATNIGSQSKTALVAQSSLAHSINNSDLTHFGLTGSDYKSSFDYSDKGLFSFIKNNKNREILRNQSINSNSFIRTFGSFTNYNALSDSDTGYNSENYGILIGFSNQLSQQRFSGYSVGLSTTNTNNNNNTGGTNSDALHYQYFTKINSDKYLFDISVGGFLSQKETTRNTIGLVQKLTSEGNDIGFDGKINITKKMNLGSFKFSPSIGFGSNIIFQDDIKEKGGSLALDIYTDNLIIIEPQIGFNLDRNIYNTSTSSSNFNFSFLASEKDYIDGTISKSFMSGMATPYDNLMKDTKKTYLTLGLGYNLIDTENNSALNINMFHTDTDDESLENSIFSVDWKMQF
ncbi:Calx-beta domain-containing protein [Candidatus Pelagibacter sp.]|uniref:Calx-beta domain-containing protein n=1 Tax=Candidatus Pelagibacter sp. TaxID=2024849 RepID=UPI003D12086A